jgi:septal ring factor EnvC (AmiA/AmiB activator)
MHTLHFLNFNNNFSQKKESFFRLITFCFVFFVCTATFAQSPSQKSLEAKRTRLQLEIKKMNSLLFQSKSEGKNLLHELSDLNLKIGVRSKLIATINQEAAVLDSKIRKNQKQIKTLEKELQLLKDDYAAMIYKSYKSKSMQSRLMFLLSADTFDQAYKRFQYMGQYTDFRKKQGEEIALQTVKVEKLTDALKVQKIEKQNLLTEQKEEQTIIEVEKKEQEVLLNEVKSQEKKYTAEIKKKQKEERKIDKQIEKIIRDAIAASKKKNKGSTSKGFALTPEAKILAAKFTQNRGKLPWPVTNALVVRKFGKVPHESISGIYRQSNGIHIATNKKAQARAIFEGTVLAIQVSSIGMKTIYVQHGNYISLYSNLETVSVQKGDPIALKQNIGEIHTDKVTGKTILKFQIWKDTSKENPASWLLRL